MACHASLPDADGDGSERPGSNTERDNRSNSAAERKQRLQDGPDRVARTAPARRRDHHDSVGSGVVKLFRRILAVLVMAGVAAGGIRLKGSGGVPPQHGGWRPLELPPEA